MKAKKALTLVPALLLVVGLGACDGSSKSGSNGGDLTPRDDAAYTLSITITYEGVVQTVPEYASIYIQGTLMDPTDNWVGETFHELTPNGTTYEFYYDEMPKAGTYEYGLVLEEKGTDESEVEWSHKVNSGSGNETFVVLGTEEYGFVNNVTVEIAQPLTDLFPDPALAPATNATFSFVISHDTTALDVYFIGGFNNDNWQTWLKCEYNATSGGWEYTFDSLALGAVSYKVVTTASGVEPEWATGATNGTVTELTDDDLSVTIDQTFTDNVYTVYLD